MKKNSYSAEKCECGVYALLPLDGGAEIIVKSADYGVRICDSDIVTVTFSKDGTIKSIVVDKEETRKRKAEARKRLSSLFDN